jgi:arsenical pump membrane protein
MTELIHTLNATWSPFVLVAGLLLIGHVAAGEGLFRLVGSWCARVSGGGVALFLMTMVAVALVTAVLNLDTSVVFMTPVALHAARAKGTDETAFLYGTIFMSNSASLLLLGSNLTNLLVFSGRGELGSVFAGRMVLPWIASVGVTIVVVLAWRWGALRRGAHPIATTPVSFTFGPGLFAAVFAVVAMLAVSAPALWVFVAGVVALAYEGVAKKRVSLRGALSVISPVTLSLLFVVAAAVGWFARSSTLTAHLLRHANVVTTMAVSGFTSLVINNLPAASLFAAHDIAHPFALLLGLDLGPNCVVTGALSSLLWWRIARNHQMKPSLVTFSVVGTLVAVLAMAAAAPLL